MYDTTRAVVGTARPLGVIIEITIPLVLLRAKKVKHLHITYLTPNKQTKPAQLAIKRSRVVNAEKSKVINIHNYHSWADIINFLICPSPK